MGEEYLWPLPSVRAFITEDLKIYKMKRDGNPSMKWVSNLSAMSSSWVNTISDNDDSLLSEMIYWWNKERE